MENLLCIPKKIKWRADRCNYDIDNTLLYWPLVYWLLLKYFVGYASLTEKPYCTLFSCPILYSTGITRFYDLILDPPKHCLITILKAIQTCFNSVLLNRIKKVHKSIIRIHIDVKPCHLTAPI